MKTKIKRAAREIIKLIGPGYIEQAIYTFGNGGSAAIANHMAVDWMKNSCYSWSVVSLVSNCSMLTMIANDYDFAETCRWQLNRLPIPHALVLISSSGNSTNIINACKWAKKQEVPIIGFTGFDGGELKKLSNVSVHITSKDYEEAEDYHQSVMHEVSRLLRSLK